VRRLALVAVGLVLAPLIARGDGPVERWGYMQTRDGAKLRYTVELPSAEGQFPVALIWSVYTDGVGPTGGYPPAESGTIAAALLDAGYAVLGVNMRGTGCSNGVWDLFQPASDGYDVVEWAGTQDWSDGNVGMFGFSAPGISQLLTAATQPPHLRAITPADVTTDFYRDVAYPGGIPNVTFTGAWTLAARPAHEELSIPYAAAQGDLACAPNIASKPVPSDYYDYLQLSQHQYDDVLWDRYSPEGILGDIEVPLLTCQAAQDDQVSSHASGWLDFVNTETSWAVFTNGHHGTCDDFHTPFTSQVVAFFDRFVRGDANGFDDTPHVQIWHETVADTDTHVATPGWIDTHGLWPVSVTPTLLYLAEGGALSPSPPAVAGSDTYAYPLPSSSMEVNEYSGATNAGWKVPSAPGGYVAYTSSPLTADMEVFGPGSADLWLTSTAPDTDLQITLTEVRPDGSEAYVGRGWLRASHRALDATRATELLPYHTHLIQDVQLLLPDEPVLARVELNPVAYTFRSGSSLRLFVEAPTGVTGLFGYSFITTPAINTIVHDAAHASRLVLGVVPGGVAPTGYPECDTVLSQPCREDLS
jgi:hypothetical protein